MEQTIAVTQLNVTGQINVALTQQSLTVQKLQDEADSLVFNEDNVEEISNFLAKLKKVDKVVDDTHKKVKGPILEQSRACDAAKNSVLSTTEAIRKPVQEKYYKICAEIDTKKQAVDKEKLRVNTIQSGIESNVVNFSTQIAACETNGNLLDVERRINLEKSPSGGKKYEEFHQQAIDRFDEVLLPILKEQKKQVKIKEELEKKMKDAESSNDVVKIDELKQKQEEIDNKILQSQVNVQQQAMLQTTMVSTFVEEVMPEIKTVKRISFEIADVKVAVSKSITLLNIETNYKECQKIAMTLKDAGTFDDKDEIVVNGIKFFIDKTYK